MIDIEQFLKDIYYPLISYTNSSQLVLANQKPPEDRLNNNRIVYNMILYANTESRQTVIIKDRVINSESEEFEHDIERENITFPRATLSFTGFGPHIRDSITKAREWFYIDGLGKYWLQDSDYKCVIKEVMEIENRTTYLESDYEKRFGFDVILGFKDIVKVTHDTIEELIITNGTTGKTNNINL